jgi:type VI secretion system secreted protein Hcp
MALNAYLKLTGDIQGEIRGSTTLAGREGTIMVIAFEHEVVSPRDRASGRPTGKRQHGALTITKEIDRSSPQLMSMLINNETIREWELRFWQPTSGGEEDQFYTIRLEDAAVSGIRQEMLNNRYPENMPHKEREHVSFCYRKITWTYEEEGLATEDDWGAPDV